MAALSSQQSMGAMSATSSAGEEAASAQLSTAAEQQRTVPIKVFLQGLIAVAVTILVVALALLMLSFAVNAIERIGQQLVEAEANTVAQRVSTELEYLRRFTAYTSRVVHNHPEMPTCELTPGLPCTQTVLLALVRSYAVVTQHHLSSATFCVMQASSNTTAEAAVHVSAPYPNATVVDVTVIDAAGRQFDYAFDVRTRGNVTNRTGIARSLPTVCRTAPSRTVWLHAPAQAFGPLVIDAAMRSTPLNGGFGVGVLATAVAAGRTMRLIASLHLLSSAVFASSRAGDTAAYPVHNAVINLDTWTVIAANDEPDPDRPLLAPLPPGEDTVARLQGGIAADAPIFFSSLRKRTKKERLSAPHEIPVMARAAVELDVLFDQVRRALQLAVVITIAIGIAVGAASSMLVHIVSKPLVSLARDMALVGRLNIEDLAQRESFVSEIHDISQIFSGIVDRVRRLREQLHLEDDDGPMSPLGAGATTTTEADFAFGSDSYAAALGSSHVLKTRVRVVYESRKSAREIASAGFDFMYTEIDTDLFDRLCSECKQACDEDEFEPVSMVLVNAKGEQVLLKHSMQLQELLASAPESIGIVMQKTTNPRYGVVFAGSFDVLNAVVTIAWAGTLLAGGVDKTVSVPFICLYLFALGMNLCLAIVLIRRAADESAGATRPGGDGFYRWLQRSSAEVATTLVLCTANLQDMELLWSSIRIGRLFRFNAPDNQALLQRAISMSVFGFLFSDVSQVLFKAWLLSVQEGEVDAFSLLALVTSGLSVLFNLIVKLHAMLLWHGSPAADRPGGSEAKHDAEHLVNKDVTVVMCRFSLPLYIRQLQLQAIEVNSFYTEAVEVAKPLGGCVLVMQAGTLLIAFNATRRCATHAENAVIFASSLYARGARHGRPISCAITSGRVPVGMLGTITVKHMHCFVDSDMLLRLCALAEAVDAGVVLTSSTLQRLGTPYSIGARVTFECTPTYFTHRGGDADEVVSADMTILCPATVLSRLAVRYATALGDTPSDASDAWLDEQRVGVVDTTGEGVRGDLKGAQIAAMEHGAGREAQLQAAEHFMRALARLDKAQAKASKDERNVFGLQTIYARSLLDGL